MPIAFDASSNQPAGSTSSISWSHVCSGTNRILFVALRLGGTTNQISSITYNGVPMTLVTSQVDSQGSGNILLLYMLVNPASGTNTISVSYTGSIFNEAVAVSYNVVAQIGQPDASTTNHTGAVTSVTTSLSTILDNCWMVSACSTAAGIGGNPSAGTGTTLRTSSGNLSIGDSNGVIHPAGSYSMTWNTGASGDLNVVQASFSPLLGTQEELAGNNIAPLAQASWFRKEVKAFMTKAKSSFKDTVDYVKNKHGIYVPAVQLVKI